MKHSTSQALYEYWNLLRGAEPAPLRSAIEPSEIRKILADTFIAEVVGPRSFSFRLAGTRICSLYDREIKGTDLIDMWSQEEDRSAIATLANAVTEDAAGAVVTIEARTDLGSDVSCELLLLPLRHGPRGFDRILGSLCALDRPTWLGTERIVSQRISGLRLIWPDRARGFGRRKTDLPSGLRAAAAQRTTPQKTGRQRGHLYVLDGGKE